MKNVGEAFAFYVKYHSEMDSLYSDEDLSILPKMEESKRQDLENRINKIGDLASEEAANLLIKISNIFLSSIHNKAGAAILRKKYKMEELWNTEIQIWPKSITSKPKDWNFTMGSSLIAFDGSFKFVIWAWPRSSSITAEKVVAKYKNVFPNIFSNVHILDKKTIGLYMQDIKVDGSGPFFVSEETLLEVSQQTATTFADKMLADFLNNFN